MKETEIEKKGRRKEARGQERTSPQVKKLKWQSREGERYRERERKREREEDRKQKKK